MTELRDARFKKALETAPDADARPAAAVARTIRDAAHQAVAPGAPAVPASAPRRWWQRLWQSAARPHAPWNAAFATVLLAVLVTLLWVREPIPDARPPAPAAPTESAPAAAPDAAPGPTPQSAPAPAPAPAPAMEAAGATKDAAPSVGAATRPAPPAARLAKAPPAADRLAGAAPVQAPPAEAGPAQAPARSKADTGLAAAPAARMGEMQGDVDARLQALPLHPEAARAAAPAPMDAAPLSAAGRSAASAAPAAAALAAPRLAGLEAWTVLSVEMEGRAVSLDRARGQHLFVDLQRLAMRMQQLPTPVAEAPTSAPTLRLSVLSRGQTLAVMDLWDETALWRRPGQADVWASLAAAEVQALLQRAHQALAPAAPE